MSMKQEYTHYGVFGVCPVFIGGVDTEAPMLCPRFGMGWLFWLSQVLYTLAFTVYSALNPMYEPLWPIEIRGKLPRPVVR